MNAAVKIEIDKAVRAIRNSIQPQKIYLFGSHAAGSATQDRDIDLCVVTSLQGMFASTPLIFERTVLPKKFTH